MIEFRMNPSKGILVFILTGFSLFAGQSLLTNGNTGTITLPAAPPYNALTDTRLEVRLTGIQPCPVPSRAEGGFTDKYVQNWFRIAGNANQSINLFALGCKTAGEW